MYVLALASPLSPVRLSLLPKHQVLHDLGLCYPVLQEVAGEARGSVGPVCPVHRHGELEPMGASRSVVAAWASWL